MADLGRVPPAWDQIYTIMTAALKNLSEDECLQCRACHDRVEWQLEPKYGFNRVYVHLMGMPAWGFVEHESKKWLARRIQVVQDTLYILDSTYLKLSQMKVSFELSRWSSSGPRLPAFPFQAPPSRSHPAFNSVLQNFRDLRSELEHAALLPKTQALPYQMARSA